MSTEDTEYQQITVSYAVRNMQQTSHTSCLPAIGRGRAIAEDEDDGDEAGSDEKCPKPVDTPIQTYQYTHVIVVSEQINSLVRESVRDVRIDRDQATKTA